MVKGPKKSNCCLSDPANEYCCQVAQSESSLLKHVVYEDIRYKSYIYEERAIHVWKDLEKVSPNWSICWTGSNILRSLMCSGRISTSIGRCKGGMTGGSVLVMSPQTYGLLCLSVIEREPNQPLHSRKELFKANIMDVMACYHFQDRIKIVLVLLNNFFLFLCGTCK